VLVTARNVHTNERPVFETDRLFLAAGVVQTADIVLSSLRSTTITSVSIKENQYFLIPALTGLRLDSNPAEERLHNLSQIFIEFLRSGDDYAVHFEIKTFDKLYEQFLAQQFGIWSTLLYPAVKALTRRLVIGTGFLHSDYSPELVLSLSEDKLQRRLLVNPK